jgi:Peptidase A4 family
MRRRRYRSHNRWWAMAAIAASLSLAAGVFIAINHESAAPAALRTSASVSRGSDGWGRGGYLMMSAPGQHAIVNRPAAQQRSASRKIDRRRWESNAQWWSWYRHWHAEVYAYWQRHRRHGHGGGQGGTPTPSATPSASVTPTTSASPTASATPTTSTTPTTGTSTPTASSTPTTTATPTTSPSVTPSVTPSATASATSPASTTGVIQTTSMNWAGYAATGAAGTFTSVASGWTVPSLTCNGTNTHSSFWVGLDGAGTSTVEQIGTEGDCDGDFAADSGWFEMFPNAPVFFNEPVKAGDFMEASVTAEGGGVFMLTLFDMTQNWSQITEQTSTAATLGSAEIITEAPSANGQVTPLSNFGTVVYTGAAINNVAIGTSPIDEITMNSANDVTMAAPSAISGGIGNFSVAWDSAGP